MAMSLSIQVPFLQKLVVGGIAGIVGTSIVYPLDMVKTRLQVCFIVASQSAETDHWSTEVQGSLGLLQDHLQRGGSCWSLQVVDFHS